MTLNTKKLYSKKFFSSTWEMFLHKSTSYSREAKKITQLLFTLIQYITKLKRLSNRVYNFWKINMKTKPCMILCCGINHWLWIIFFVEKIKKYISNQWFISQHNIIQGIVFMQFFLKNRTPYCPNYIWLTCEKSWPRGTSRGRLLRISWFFWSGLRTRNSSSLIITPAMIWN